MEDVFRNDAATVLHIEASPSGEFCGWVLGQYQNDVNNVLGGGK